MALDSNGLWVPGLTHLNSIPTAYGVGSPEGVAIGWPGATYVDTDGETLWFKASGDGTTTGWVEVTGGGGGSGELTTLEGTGTPEGAVAGDPGWTYWDSSNKQFWVKNNGTGNTGWERQIG